MDMHALEISPIARSFGAVQAVVDVSFEGVPLWHLLLSAVLTYLTAYSTLRLAAGIFHAQNLLSGRPFSVSRYLRALSSSALPHRS
jgi:hypothetical protein